MMSRRRHHHKPPSSNPITTNHLHHAGTAAEEDPMMIHSHRIVHLQPNVIARLMGIDDDAIVVPTPPPPKPAAGTVHVQFRPQRRRRTNKFSVQVHSYRGGNDDAEYCSPSSRLFCLSTMTTMRVPGGGWRPRPRRPQEEEELLQKMRQDLRAWQASRAPALLQTSSNSCSRPSSDSDGGNSSSLVLQAIAQEDLRKQKMARYGIDLGFGLGHSKVTQLDGLLRLIESNKDGVARGDTSGHAVAASGDLEARRDGDGHGHGHGHGAPVAQAQGLPTHRHTRPIVLLKPTTCSESETAGGLAIGDGQKTVLLGLPKLHRDANMSVLLQEVKDRVQRELTLTAVTTRATDGEITKAPTWATPPLQQATKQTKEARGNKRRLFRRSESFRAFRSDRKRNASPEAYIVKSKTSLSPEKADEESMTDASLSSVLRPGVGGGVTDCQSFRSECLTTKHRDDDATAASPRLLLRSFSAPESGFSFSLGKLFSFKQKEASETAAAAEVTMTSKNVVSAGFSSFMRGTVSSLRRHGFSSRRKLMMFRRKTHWSWSNKTSLGAGEIHPAKMEVPISAATTPPQETFNLFKVAQANLNELPPSPVSPLEVAAGHNSRHFFTDLHCTLPPEAELSPKWLSEFEAPPTASETSFRTDITAVETAWSRDKAYITELLIAAGLYDDGDGSPSNYKANARVDSMARPMPICDDVFEDVEDMYYYRGDYITGSCDGTDHSMLFDLANEALQSLVTESSRGGSWSLRRWVVDSTGVSRGKKLVDDVWQQVQALRNHPQAQEMQTIVACEVQRSVWAEVLYEDVYVVGRKIERVIFDELIDDLFLHALEVFR